MIIFSSKDSEQQLKKLVIELWKTGGTRTEISPSDLTALPPFLRFNIVQLEVAELGYVQATQPIADKCLLFENLLQQSLKPALDGSVLAFGGDIDENDTSCFHNHLELLNYLRDRILPICNKSCEYKFEISFDSDKSAAEHVIASILETPQLNHCSSAQFRIYYGSNEPQLRLPIKEISIWLHRKCDREGKKSLHIYSHGMKIENIEAIINHLKKVLFLLNILNACIIRKKHLKLLNYNIFFLS